MAECGEAPDACSESCSLNMSYTCLYISYPTCFSEDAQDSKAARFGGVGGTRRKLFRPLMT